MADPTSQRVRPSVHAAATKDISDGDHPLASSVDWTSQNTDLAESREPYVLLESTPVLQEEATNCQKIASQQFSHSVLNGLKVKLPEHANPLATFSYALYPCIDKYMPVDWILLVANKVQGQHIRCHTLQQGDNLSFLIATSKAQQAEAIILINTQDNYSIAPQFQEGISTSSLLVVVLTQSDGSRLLKIINQNRNSVLARLDSGSYVDTVVETNGEDPNQAGLFKPKESKEGVGLKTKTTLRIGKGPPFGLKRAIKELMFSSDKKPMIVSDDQAKITSLMAKMTDYERLTTEEGTHSNSAYLNEVVKKMRLHMDELCDKDFPLYIVVVYRLHAKKQFYLCEELKSFIAACLYKIESLSHKKMAQVFNDFLKRGDFPVICGTTRKEFNVKMFWYLECACKELSELSFDLNQCTRDIQQQRGAKYGSLHPNFCRNRMMWLSLALKIHSVRFQTTTNIPNLWYDKFVRHHSEIVVTDTNNKEIADGLECGKLLNLPREYSFNSELMMKLIVSEQVMRPFQHLWKLFESVESYYSESEILTMLTHIRAEYFTEILEPTFRLDSLSTDHEGTIKDAIAEAITFLDFLILLWERRHFKAEILDAECTHWTSLLLSKVDITKEQPDVINLFLKNTAIGTNYQQHIYKQIMEITRKNFHKLSIQQFLPFLKAFKFWSSEFLDEYLKEYHVQPDSTISVGASKEIISESVRKFPGAHHHYFLLGFLQKISEVYQSPESFVVDLLQLGVPNLFSVPSTGIEQIEHAEGVRKIFNVFLRSYILTNDLKSGILSKWITILDAISEDEDEFQELILEVLRHELIPEFRTLQTLETGTRVKIKNYKAVLLHSVNILLKNLFSLSSKQAFCWGIVASCCSRIHISSENLEWFRNYSYVISVLGKIFNAYCTERKLTDCQCVIIESLPPDICAHPSDLAKCYFKWVGEIQSSLKGWKEKFESEEVNYDQILLYASFNFELDKLCSSVLCSTTLMVDSQTVQNLKSTFLAEFESLNILLLKYVSKQHDTKWCNFLTLIQEYGVALPKQLATRLEKFIVIPDGRKEVTKNVLDNDISPATNGRFHPGCDISLLVTKNLSLKELTNLVHDLKEFQNPLEPYLDMLVFFKLNHSEMFDKYVHIEIEQALKTEFSETSKQCSSDAAHVFKFAGSDQSSPQATESKSQVGITVTILGTCLKKTKQLITKIMNGKAAYIDIIANKTLDLTTLDIEQEFITLKNYATISDISSEGLSGVRNLLELFQYTTHIQNIYDVCDQFQLQGCLKDEELETVQSLVANVKLEGNSSKLTPNEASEKMKQIKEILCITRPNETNPNISEMRCACLEVFPIVANSADFFNFIREKHFYGENGQATFQQQYELITAQLQHEEYDESVLNHLLAAFKIITPFLNSYQSFKELMTKVTDLDITFGLKQLETVNMNITLIRLWFSKVEGDTLQNVAKELEKVLDIGYYTFKLIDGEAQISLEFIPLANQITGEIADSRVSALAPDKALKFQSSQSSTVSKGKRLKKEQWNSEQIRDFVRKLGFMDTEKGRKDIKHFRHISATAYRLLELYSQLKELGDPHYFQDTVATFPCSIECSDADKKVRETEISLENWRKNVAELRNRYHWLLFVNIPKILRLYELLSNSFTEPAILDIIVCEISFLCKNNQPTRDSLKKSVEEEMKNNYRDINQEIPPMQIVGQFLDALFNDKQNQLPKRSSSTTLVPHRLFSHLLLYDVTHPLHFCPHYNQSQLIQTVVGICCGVPEAFEVFRCQSSTKMGQLSLFLERAARHSLRSIVLEVNKLPFKLQESLFQLPQVIQAAQNQEVSSDSNTSTETTPHTYIHFIETEPSALRNVPWIQLREHSEPIVKFEEARKMCVDGVVLPEDFACIKLVVGAAGDGKTHYIKEQLATSPAQLTIAVNEAFTPLKAISKLCTIPVNQRGASIFFNFTMLPPGDSVDESECKRFEQLMEVIGWFFFDLLILGYVEDPATGKSFRIPGGLEWAIYVEVPSSVEKDVSNAMQQFREEVPTLSLLGSEYTVRAEVPYKVDEDVQLVCKYLQAYDKGGVKGIDQLYKEGGKRVKFSENPDLSPKQCHQLLYKYMPRNICTTKITQKLFVKYMKRRCNFLDNLPAFNYNTGSGEYKEDEQGKGVTDIKQLGSTLMRTMLKEVSDFCDPTINYDNWSKKPHQQFSSLRNLSSAVAITTVESQIFVDVLNVAHQLIYDYKDSGASFGLIMLHPQKLPEEEISAFKKIGIQIPSVVENYYTRDVLDDLLSRALNVQLENKCLKAIDDSAYVLTLDYTIKMLNIHERLECGVPVIIEGETGVGKTALVEMLSKLWNQSLLLEWKKQQERIVHFFVQKIREVSKDSTPNYELCCKTVEQIEAGEYVDEDSLITLCQLPSSSHGKLYIPVQVLLNPIRNDPIAAQLTLKDSQFKEDDITMEQLFINAGIKNTPKDTAKLLQAILCAKLEPTFYKINVHAAMTPADIEKQFKPIIVQAKELSDFFHKSKDRVEKKNISTDQLVALKPRRFSTKKNTSAKTSLKEEEKKYLHKMPFVTVFLDEVNTSSCVGLFKEIIVDRTFNGEPIPENIFIVAACNPHRGNSMASLGIQGGLEKDKEKWVRGAYYVRKLHPTLRLLMWDYGSLDERQEREYVNAKMRMVNKNMSNSEVASLADLIVESQNQIRKYADQQIRSSMKGDTSSINLFAKISSRSCVSQRDIQRVFTLIDWFKKMYEKLKPHGNGADYNRHAVLVALGIVYYMRLNVRYRREYIEFIDSECRLPGDVSFTAAFDDELNWFSKHVMLPKGIARTRALMENIFATIVCTLTHIPLIIVGAPGSSKTLSFNQTIVNLKGAESRVKVFRDTSIFHSLDPHYYQCSRHTTSIEIQTVFSRAVNRQHSYSRFNLHINCVVFMDEAGLPEESHESLKVLHYHLDKHEVSFVAITNHVLDAAKTNRAVSLFRPEASDEDLETLAKGCFCSNPNKPHELKEDLKSIVKFCKPYSTLMGQKWFAQFFGLRDFIQFVIYLHRRYDPKSSIGPQLVLQALERNFNGCENFDKICSEFLKEHLSEVNRRGILDILQASLLDQPQEKEDLGENEVRYKLIIDPSEDDSLVRLLFTFGILKRDNTRIFVCSNFPADSHLQKINTIAAIRHSAMKGHTVVMSQTDDIHESFYDLFNQRFRRIDDLKEGPRYYANIAIGAHLRPSRIHPNFQCVVVVKKSEVKNTPAPFLNRFEKYLITHQIMLETALNRMRPSISVLIRAAMDKVKDFIALVSGSESLYGLRPDTLNSLVISLLPSVDHAYKEMRELSLVDDPRDVRFYVMQEIVQALRECTGLFIPKCAKDEFRLDVDSVFEVVLLDPQFKGLMRSMSLSSAAKAIPEAFNVLHLHIGPDKEEHLDVSPEVCMVIALVQQWLVRHLCKKLTQLMTSEALVLHRNKIPFPYINNYLNFQAHFSLHKLIESYHKAAEFTLIGPPSFRSATKVLCFTRSSPLIHQLPAEFPSSALSKEIEDKTKHILGKFIHNGTNKLVTYKLSSVFSQTTIENLIQNFMDSNQLEVCLIVINLQETSKEFVNHLRIMIEEAEFPTMRQTTKLFIVLLHFPPAQFFKPCYPTLFLKGWDHCYLDVIAYSNDKGVVDIRDWFWQCCFPKQLFHLEDKLLQALLDMLPRVIPDLVSRVLFGSRPNGVFNCSMDVSNRIKILKKLLLDKRHDGITVGRVLCEKFRAYWTPNVMAEQLEKAAIFSRDRESTLSITESIQTKFNNLFKDFLVYIISRINEDYNIDILLNDKCSDAIQVLFLEILRVFPTSNLSQISLLSNNLPLLQPLVYLPNFPFFKLVFEIMEKFVEQSREEANNKLNILCEASASEDTLISLDFVFNTLEKVVTDRISKEEENSTRKKILKLVVQAVSNCSELWNKYFNDFVLHKLQLDYDDSSEGFAQQILLIDFAKGLNQLDALKRIVSLHTLVHVYQLDLAKMVFTLRPLNTLKKLQKDFSVQSTLNPGPLQPSPQLLYSLAKETQHPFGSSEHLVTFTVSMLFNALVTYLYSGQTANDTAPADMKVWYDVYRNLMMLPNLAQHIYSALSVKGKEMSTVEAKLNLIQTTFLALQTSTDMEHNEDILTKGKQIFCTLFTRHFDEAANMRTECPRLRAVAPVALEVFAETGLSVGWSSLSIYKSESARIILEGLFAHFFSPERQHYNNDDICWFLWHANNQTEWKNNQLKDDFSMLSTSQTEGSPTPKMSKAPHINIFKFYLGKILGQRDSSEDTDLNPLQLYQQFPREKIGIELTKTELDEPKPYIPKVYSGCNFIKVNPSSECECIQQPLAHLYFLTVLEHLMTKQYKVINLMRIASNINTLCNSQPTSKELKVVLYIELQAVIQVIAQRLALHLDPTHPNKIEDILCITEDLNKLLDDVTTGGGHGGGHSMVVALHLFKSLKSSQQLIDLFTKSYDSVFRGITCLEEINEQLKTHSDYYAHLLPFMLPEAQGDMATLYNQVKKNMTAFYKGSGSTTSLKQLAKECYQLRKRPTVTLRRSGSFKKNRKDMFIMMVWLVTYYEFFCKNITSKPLCDFIGSQDMLPYLEEEAGYVRMIQCFLWPDLMIHHGSSGDPVYDLFKMPSNPNEAFSDKLKADLNHSLANLVAVVMGCPTQSNHLWFHMFAPEKLVNSYMTGFMYDSLISPDGLQYDCGVELTEEGEFGRSDYLKHAGRGTYTLHSLYLILWANFGAFTMSLLTLPDADARIHGHLISERQSVRHYCVTQLKAMWQHIRNNMGLSEEERTFFVNQCLKTFHEVVSSPQDPLASSKKDSLLGDNVQGVFTSREELDAYERMWHLNIYKPTWNQLREKLAANYSNQWQNILFTKLRCLEVHYPHFPSEADFLHCIISYGDLEQHSEGGELRGLSQFTQSWKTLQAGGLLLPDLVEFYQWLHTELAYLLTYEEATTASILKVVQLAANNYGSERGRHILELYEQVKEGYNKYVTMVGGVIGAGACAALKQGNKVYTIADDIPLLHFLTDSEEEEEGNDWLFTVIAHIVAAQNLAVENLYAMIKSNKHIHLARLLPDCPAKVTPTEITDKNWKFSSLHGVSSLLQTIRSRYHDPMVKFSDVVIQETETSSSSVLIKEDPKFQLRYLEEDLLKLLLAGSPLIESPSSIRILFRFKRSSNLDVTVPDGAILNLEDVGNKLPNEYKEPLPSDLQKCLEYEFHSCGYSNLMEVITALHTICSHLKKVIMEKTHPLNKENLKELTLPKFMMDNVYQHINAPKVFLEIGLTHNSLNHLQLACLTKLPLCYIFSCLKLFVHWVDQGVYDFCALPLTLKDHLSEADLMFIERELREQWTGTLKDLEVEVKQLIEVLKHSEGDIAKKISKQTSKTSLIQYLKDYLLTEETDKLPPLIPETIVLQHYVHFRLSLRRLLIRLRAELKNTYGDGEGKGNQWSEFVTDLWSTRLTHLREVDGDFVYDTNTGHYGFEYVLASTSDHENGLLLDLGKDQYEQNVEVKESAVNFPEEDSFAEVDESLSKQVSDSDYCAVKLEAEQDPKTIEQKRDSRAETYEPEDVADFLSSIKLDRYRDAFISNDVKGVDLLEADVESLNAIGVESSLDCVRILTLFRRLDGTEPRIPISEVLRFLKENGFEKHCKHFEENQIDGDMMVDTEVKVMKDVLKEFGIDPMERVKIVARFRASVKV